MKKLLTTLVLALLSTGLLACGGSDDSATTNATSATSTATTATATTEELPLLDDRIYDSHVRYAADPGGALAYNIAEASASAGKATIEFVNPQNVVHNVVIEGRNGGTIGETKKIGKGITSTEVMLKPGVYRIYCSVPGHRKAGMQGHLTVQ
jgi:plastocyanin